MKKKVTRKEDCAGALNTNHPCWKTCFSREVGGGGMHRDLVCLPQSHLHPLEGGSVSLYQLPFTFL